jgi:ferredoxin/flavodoxin---NADP+ reductase
MQDDNNRPMDNNIYEVKDIQFLTESAFIITFPKCRFSFIAGQHFNLSLKDEPIGREYSIYSGVDDDNLEILVKEVEDGYLTPKLKYLKKGDLVKINGPFGRFHFDSKKALTHKHVFIATGTGIAPLHCMIKSFPDIDYSVIQGVRFAEEAYEKEDYSESKYTLCTSRDDKGDFNGRLTEYLKRVDFEENTCFYLCGNNEMIYDAKEIIKSKGFDSENVHIEVYF